MWYNRQALERETHISRGGAGVARRAHNPKVVGSNPAPATILNPGHETWVFYCVFYSVLL